MILLLASWWASSGWSTANADQPPPAAPPPVAPLRADPAPADAARVPSPPESVREDVTPLPTPAPAPEEAPAIALSKDQLGKIQRIKRFSGIAPEFHSQLEDLARRKPEQFAELVEIVETTATPIGQLLKEAYRIQDEIVAARLREGRFDTTSDKIPRPLPEVEGEVIHSMVEFDPARGEGVRKVFRILPGESPEFDLVHARMRSEKSGLARIVTDFLAATR